MKDLVTCPECSRSFDLLNENDSAEWHYGHDCEDTTTVIEETPLGGTIIERIQP